MNQILSDTSSEVERLMIEGYRKMPAWIKIQQVFELNQLTRQLAINDIRRRYPNADEREIILRLASRFIDAELLKKAFNWNPKIEGY